MKRIVINVYASFHGLKISEANKLDRELDGSNFRFAITEPYLCIFRRKISLLTI